MRSISIRSTGPLGRAIRSRPRPGQLKRRSANWRNSRPKARLGISASRTSMRSNWRALVKVAPITSLQPPYSLLSTEVAESTLPFAHSHHVGAIVYSPMASGMLSGAMTRERIAAMPEDDWRKRSENFREPALTRNLRLVEDAARHWPTVQRDPRRDCHRLDIEESGGHRGNRGRAKA